MRSRIVSMGLALSLGVLWLSASSSLADPPGNNGTVKVDGAPFDSHPNNEPHPGCTFQIDFYGYDQGDLDATITFRGIAPTGGGVLESRTVFIGEDRAGGGRDLDGSVTVDLSQALSGVEAHPKQGYHVKLTVHAEGSQGADVKHKVFWVSDCGGAGGGGGGGGGGAGGGGAGGGGAGGGAGAAAPANAVTGAPAFTG